jgi:hypothetical protein
MEHDQEHDYHREFKHAVSLDAPSVEEVNQLMEGLLGDILWLLDIIDKRIEELNTGKTFLFSDYSPPELKESSSAYQQIVKDNQLSNAERLLLIASIVPHLAPYELTKRLRHDENHLKLKYKEFGGFIDTNFNQFTITQQTVLFLLAGTDATNQVYYQLALSNNCKLIKEGIIRFETARIDLGLDNELNKVLVLTKEHLLFLQSGQEPRPDYGSAFPATLVTTGLEWENLVLSETTKKDISDIMLWVEHGNDLINSSSAFNISYPCLFYGPSGTGKSLTAKLIGKKYNKHVFRVDLSMIVSKYIGETEKNLAHLFDRAQGKDWILFFDEADALFSKRTSINSSQDKWANLEVNYLLQRMEEHRGLTILATNLKENIDNAMTRRFQAMIYFPTPKQNERHKLWETLLPNPFTFEESISPKRMSEFDFTGANISNIIKYACLRALNNETHEIKSNWLQAGIRKEFIKENRTP